MKKCNQFIILKLVVRFGLTNEQHNKTTHINTSQAFEILQRSMHCTLLSGLLIEAT